MAFSDPWVASPFSSTKNTQHPEYSKPFTTPLSFNSRASTDSFPPLSPSPFSSSLRLATPPSTIESMKGRGKLWKAMKHFFTCYSPVGLNPRGKEKSSRKDKSLVSTKTSSVHSVMASPGHVYSAMNAEERDESLKAVIRYCKKSKEQVLNDPNCNRRA